MDSPAALVRQSLGAEPFDGSPYASRGRKGRLVNCLWHNGVGMCLLPRFRAECPYAHWFMSLDDARRLRGLV